MGDRLVPIIGDADFVGLMGFFAEKTLAIQLLTNRVCPNELVRHTRLL